jgi:electron transfer flavoprotein alpha subunit
MIMTVMEGAATLNKSERYEALVLGAELPGSVASMVEDLGVRRLAADKAPLEEAPLVIGAGAGVSAWSAFASVAASLHAATACTRVISDQRLMSRERQVGASGRTIAADCYLAFGVSGALQHLQGIEACARVVAVNTDPHAAMIKRADLAVIADANDVLIALQRLLERNACN